MLNPLRLHPPIMWTFGWRHLHRNHLHKKLQHKPLLRNRRHWPTSFREPVKKGKNCKHLFKSFQALIFRHDVNMKYICHFPHVFFIFFFFKQGLSTMSSPQWGQSQNDLFWNLPSGRDKSQELHTQLEEHTPRPESSLQLCLSPHWGQKLICSQDVHVLRSVTFKRSHGAERGRRWRNRYRWRSWSP